MPPRDAEVEVFKVEHDPETLVNSLNDSDSFVTPSTSMPPPFA